jgi:hypothetical protein
VDVSTAGARFLLSFVIPFCLLLIGAMGKHLIAREFRWSNVYLGPELALAAISAGLLNFLNMLDIKEIKELLWKIIYNLGYVVLTILHLHANAMYA